MSQSDGECRDKEPREQSDKRAPSKQYECREIPYQTSTSGDQAKPKGYAHALPMGKHCSVICREGAVVQGIVQCRVTATEDPEIEIKPRQLGLQFIFV
jgi:hypothetical protein